MNIAVVLLAAGASTRFGSPKLVVPIAGVPLVRRAALAALEIGADVVVVTGAHRALVEAQLADLHLRRMYNADWEDGMGRSIACGINALGNVCDAAIIALADQPRIGATELHALINAHAHAPKRIIAAQFDGVLCPPCLFPRRYFADLVALRGNSGAKGVLQRHAQDVEALPMPQAAVDVDTPEDYSGLAVKTST